MARGFKNSLCVLAVIMIVMVIVCVLLAALIEYEEYNYPSTVTEETDSITTPDSK